MILKIAAWIGKDNESAEKHDFVTFTYWLSMKTTSRLFFKDLFTFFYQGPLASLTKFSTCALPALTMLTMSNTMCSNDLDHLRNPPKMYSSNPGISGDLGIFPNNCNHCPSEGSRANVPFASSAILPLWLSYCISGPFRNHEPTRQLLFSAVSLRLMSGKLLFLT